MLLKTAQNRPKRKIKRLQFRFTKILASNFFCSDQKMAETTQKVVASSYKVFSNDFDELARHRFFEKLDFRQLFPLFDRHWRLDQIMFFVPRNHLQTFWTEKNLLYSIVRQDDVVPHLEKGELGQSRNQIGGRFAKTRMEDSRWQVLVHSHPQSPHLLEGHKDWVEGQPVHPGVHVQGLHVRTAALDGVHQLRFEKRDWKRKLG